MVYAYPRDHPKSPFVVREWHIVRGATRPKASEHVWGAQTLEAARADIPEGLVNIGRQPTDDSKIVEVWT